MSRDPEEPLSKGRLPTAGRQLRYSAYRAFWSAAPTQPPGGRLPTLWLLTLYDRPLYPSFRRKSKSSGTAITRNVWIPACAGMTMCRVGCQPPGGNCGTPHIEPSGRLSPTQSPGGRLPTLCGRRISVIPAEAESHCGNGADKERKRNKEKKQAMQNSRQ